MVSAALMVVDSFRFQMLCAAWGSGADAGG